MKALSYLIIFRMKNRILSLKKKPALLILYLFITAICLLSIILMLFTNNNPGKTASGDERVLLLILFGIGMFYFWIYTNSGLSTGSSLFTMPDIGLLFVAPISPKKILMYGLINTVGKTLLGSIFILFQIGNLKNSLNYGFREIIILFLVFALMALFGQLLSIGIYILTNSNPVRKKIILSIFYTLAALIILSIYMIQHKNQIGLLDAAIQFMDAKWTGYIPVAGWTTMLFYGCVHHQISSIIIAAAFFAGFGGLILILLTAGNADYYEDVLVSTETVYQTQKAAKEGRMVQSSIARKVKVRDNTLGINNGSGVSALFYKQLLEMKRKSRLVFIDSYTIFVMAGSGIAGYYASKINIPEYIMIYIILAAGVYMQFIFSMMGRLKNELQKPYIYLIPEKSGSKVFAASLISLLKQAVDGIAIFLAYTLGSRSLSPHSLFAAIAYTASGAVFVALTILYQRVLGAQPNRMVQMLLSMLLLTIIMGPSIALTVFAVIALPAALQFLCTLPFTVISLLVTVIIFLTCGNLIDKSEFTGK